jgi:hypothetical protein
MGERLVKAYEGAKLKGGIPAQMRLAIKTLIPLDKAKSMPDSDENIKKFTDALKEILNTQDIPKF